MTDLIQELQSHGLYVPDNRRPLSELEPGRIESFRRTHLGKVTQREMAQAIGGASNGSITERTYQNWNSKPSSINASQAERLVDCLSQCVATQYGINSETARTIVLDGLTENGVRAKADDAYNRGMVCILSCLPVYMFHNEMRSLCELAAHAVIDRRKSQTTKGDTAAFVALAEAFLALHDEVGGGTDSRVEAACVALEDAIETFSTASKEARTDGQLYNEAYRMACEAKENLYELRRREKLRYKEELERQDVRRWLGSEEDTIEDKDTAKRERNALRKAVNEFDKAAKKQGATGSAKT